MKILIDFVHLPNVNFFKNSVKLLTQQGHSIVITTQKRGRLPEIVKKEFPNHKVYVFGGHRGTFYSIIVESNIIRFFRMVRIIISQKPDVGISVVSFPLEIAMRLFGKPNYQFSDDPERKHDFIFHKLFATEVYFPPIIDFEGKFKTFNALKEWAYLSPDYFTPNEIVLSEYGLRKKKYIFIREPSTGSLNYKFQDSGLVLRFAEKIPKEYDVLLSLENKATKDLYPKNWLLLQEPINDIHSLMYFSKYVISSGDSMAREGAMLGVPSIYCGGREMKANDILINKGLLYKIAPNLVCDFILNNDNNLSKTSEQVSIRKVLNDEWDDVTKLILNIIKKTGDGIEY